MKRLLVFAATALAVAACGTRQTATDGVLVLTASVPQLDYRAGDVIDVTTTLEYVGPDREVLVRGLPIGLVSLWLCSSMDGS